MLDFKLINEFIAVNLTWNLLIKGKENLFEINGV